MPPKTRREELIAKIKANEKLIQKLFPNFKLSEAQINAMLSQDKMLAHEAIKKHFSTMPGKEETKAEIKKYLIGSVPPEMDRIASSMVKMDGSVEAQIHNTNLFSNLNRDDELGVEARKNVSLKALNAITEIDLSIVDGKHSEAQIAEYITKNYGKAVTAFSIKSVMDSGLFNIADQEKFNISKNLAEIVGGYLMNKFNLMNSDYYITFPLEYLTYEQVDVFVDHYASDTTHKEIYPILNALKAVKERESGKIASSIADYKQYGKSILFSSAELEPKPGVLKKTEGGLVQRIDNLSKGIAYIKSVMPNPEHEGLTQYEEKLSALYSYIKDCKPYPNTEQEAEIIRLAGECGKIYNTEIKNSKIDESNGYSEDKIKEVANSIRLFREAETLHTLVEFAKLDAAKLEQSGYFQQMEDGIKQLNSMEEAFKNKTIYGEDELLSSDDIAVFSAKIAETLKAANDYLDSHSDEEFISEHKSEINQAKQTVIRLKQEKAAFEKALPGMSLEEIQKGSERILDVTGKLPSAERGSMSNRMRITMTGADGSKVKGYFTKSSYAGFEGAMKKIAEEMKEQYPDKVQLIDQLAAEYLKNRLDFSIKNRWETKLAQKSLLDERTKNLLTSISDMVLEQNRLFASYNVRLGASEGSRIDTRNVAMSNVADILNVGNIIARSRKLSLADNGKIIEGIFMETAKGYDASRLDHDSRIPLLKADSLDGSPALKNIADMQILDFICGNIDRHMGNILYDIDENGKVQGIMGIDNDLSFFTKDSKKVMEGAFTPLNSIVVISESMKKSVETLSDDMLRSQLDGCGLKKEEIDAAVVRLHEVQEGIRNGQFTVKSDEDFKSTKLVDCISQDPVAAMFSQFGRFKDDLELYAGYSPEKWEKEIKKCADDAKKKNIKDTEVDLFDGIDVQGVKQDMDPLNKLKGVLEDAERNVHFGSDEFEKVKTSLDTIIKATKAIAQNGKYAKESVLEKLKHEYSKVEAECNGYLNYKKDQGKLEKGGKTGKRIAAVRDVLKFVQSKQLVISEQVTQRTKTNEISNMKKDAERIHMEAYLKNPTLAGDVVKMASKASLETDKLCRTNQQAAEQIKIAMKFASQYKISMEEMGLNTKDVENAKLALQKGREATVAIAKNADKPKAEKKNIQAGEIAPIA